ncbi:MAG: hypothetical protein U1F39_06095 [Steroidobacteraceae bacterium]
MLVAAEQPLICQQRGFDLGVLRQERAFDDAIAFRGLALGKLVILDAMLGHEPGGFLRHRAAQVIGSSRGALGHDPGDYI